MKNNNNNINNIDNMNNNINIDSTISLNSYWVTGFTDGEGCFMVNTFFIKRVTKWEIRPAFQIRIHIRDINILLQIKEFFNNIGHIYIDNSVVVYKVQRKEDLLDIIIPHFEKYMLMTEKQNDFNIFKTILRTENKSLFDSNEIIRILEQKASLNRGLSEKMKILFPNIVTTKRSINRSIISINPYWFAGFFSAEGCFFIKKENSLNSNVDYYIRLRIEIGQHSRDEVLITYFNNFLGEGSIVKHKKRNYIYYSVSKFEDIYLKVIPFFKKYQIIGEKSLDFEDFCKVAELIKNKTHLTKQGLKEILLIKSGMNKNRYS